MSEIMVPLGSESYEVVRQRHEELGWTFHEDLQDLNSGAGRWLVFRQPEYSSDTLHAALMKLQAHGHVIEMEKGILDARGQQVILVDEKQQTFASIVKMAGEL